MKTMHLHTFTLWQEGDGYKDDPEEPNDMLIEMQDDCLVISTEHFCLGIEELEELISLLKDDRKQYER